MENITVPQFIDTEDTIIGPITVRQFIEMLIAGLLCFIYYKVFDFSLFTVSSFLTVGVVLIFAFAKINGQKFHDFLLNLFTTLKNPKLKVWRRERVNSNIKVVGQVKKPIGSSKLVRSNFTPSSLSELALVVDTGGVYQGETVLIQR